MSKAPNDYRPPPSHFPLNNCIRNESTVVGQKKKIVKTKATKTQKDATNTTLNAETQLTIAPGGSKVEVVNSGVIRQSCFRDLDVDILLLLRDELCIPSTTQSQELTLIDDSNALKLTDLKFILQDFITKLSIVTTEPTTCHLSKPKPEHLSVLQLVHPLKFITDCIRLFPSVTKHIKYIKTYIEVSAKPFS